MWKDIRNLISWEELKKINSWKELQNISTIGQIRITAICFLKALKHWQIWLAMIFLGVLAYISSVIGNVLGLKFGVLNLVGLLAAAIGGGIFAVLITQQAKNHLSEVTKTYINKENIS